jgi:hypothetical protein
MLRLWPLITLCLMTLSCQQNAPTAPEIYGQERIAFSEKKIVLPDGEYIYRQGIELAARPETEEQTALRVSTLSGEAPAGYFCDESGYLWFRVPGADEDIPLSEPGPHRSIWTLNRKFGFDYASEQGRVADMVTRAEFKVKAPDGSVSTISSPFRSSRIISSQIAIPFANGAVTGCGVVFHLQETIGDIFVDGLYADHFMFRLNILDAGLQVVSNGEWHSSLAFPDLRKVTLNANSDPPLTANQADQYSQFEMYVVTRQGVQEAGTHTVHFRAAAGSYPITRIYPQTLCGLGQYHHGIDPEEMLNGVELIPSGDARRNRKLWFDADEGEYEAIVSTDFKLHLEWGYKGLYGVFLTPWGYIEGGPFDPEHGTTYNEQGDPYYSAVVAYDLRWNGAPFPALSQFVAPELVTDQQGLTWLRVRDLGRNSRRCVLSGLAPGSYQFQVRAVDAQGAFNPDPAGVTIDLAPFRPSDQRSGILLVDDTPHHSNLAPDAIVNPFYQNSVPTSYGPVDSHEMIGPDSVSPVQLQNYKAVLWYADNPSQVCNLRWSLDALNLYLADQGKLLVSGTHKLHDVFNAMLLLSPEFCSQRLGLDASADIGYLSSSFATRPFFIKAIGLNGLNDIDLNLATPFNAIVNSMQGLATVTYFNPGTGLNYLYGFGCKPVDAPTSPPTQEQYDLYSGKFVGYKHEHNGSAVVVFGFPLAYMEQPDVAAALNGILADIINGKSYVGRLP